MDGFHRKLLLARVRRWDFNVVLNKLLEAARKLADRGGRGRGYVVVHSLGKRGCRICQDRNSPSSVGVRCSTTVEPAWEAVMATANDGVPISWRRRWGGRLRCCPMWLAGVSQCWRWRVGGVWAWVFNYDTAARYGSLLRFWEAVLAATVAAGVPRRLCVCVSLGVWPGLRAWCSLSPPAGLGEETGSEMQVLCPVPDDVSSWTFSGASLATQRSACS